MKSRFVLFALAFSFHAMSFEYKSCIGGSLQKWSQQISLPMNIENIDYANQAGKLLKHYWNEGEYDDPNDNPEWRHLYSEDIEPRHNYVVSAKAKSGEVAFSFKFSARFFQFDKTKFGSNEIEVQRGCCFEEGEITITDITNGFTKSFDTKKLGCSEAVPAIQREIDKENKVYKLKYVDEPLCEAHGKKNKKWSYSEEKWESNYGPNGGDIYKYVYQLRGCKPLK